MNDIKMEMCPVFQASDIKKMIGVDWSECEFTQMAENDSYQAVVCSDSRLEDIAEDLNYYEDKFEDLYVQRLQNEATLINYLRKNYGIKDIALFCVSW